MRSWFRRRRTRGSVALEALLADGAQLLGEGQVGAAVECYDEAVRRFAERPEAWRERGRALSLLGRIEEAAESYERAVLLGPSDWEAWFQKGLALDQLGAYRDAAESFARVIRLRPEYGPGHRRRGAALRHLRELPEAVECLRRAVALDPESADTWYDLAVTSLAADRVAEATAGFERYLDLAPADHERREAAERVLAMLRRQSGTAASEGAEDSG